MLPRRCFLGAAVRDGARGVEVTRVFGGSMAERAGLEPMDVIVAFGGPTPDRATLIEACRARAGRPTRLEVLRGDARVEAVVDYVPFPAERVPGAQVIYGESDGARTILTAPPGADTVVCYLPGIAYVPVDFALRESLPEARFLADLAAAGLATFRVERPGLGDSPGEPASFLEEQHLYRRAIEALDGFERVVLFGHSVGGMHAPMLADLADALVVYGTTARCWSVCLREGRARQARLRGVTCEEPQGWPPGRGERFHRELEASDLEAAWRAAGVPHLAVIGQYDWVVGEEDQRAVGGDTILLDGLDHAFTRHPSLEASLREFGRGAYEPRLAAAVARWVRNLSGGESTGWGSEEEP